MINIRGLSLIFVFFLILTTVMTSSFLLAQADQNEETLRRNLAALQKTSPGSSQERSLQKTIIGIVRKMKRAPSLPEAADRHMARGEAFVETAKSKSGFALAIREFRAVTRQAPWLARAYYNLGVVQEKAGRYNAAKESFGMYIFAAPNAPDARKVKRLIYKIEARKEAAAAQAGERKKQDQARLEREKQRRQRKRDAKLSRLKQQLEGPWCQKARRGGCGNIENQFTITLRGNRFEAKQNLYYKKHGYSRLFVLRGEILDGRRIKGTISWGELLDGNDARYSSACRGRRHFHKPYNVEGKIKPGGRRIVFTYVEDYNYYWNTAECRHRVRRGNNRLVRFEWERLR